MNRFYSIAHRLVSVNSSLRNHQNISPSIVAFFSNKSHLSHDNVLKNVLNSQQKEKQQAKITLLNKDDTMSVTTLEEAQKLSKRRELKLVKVTDYDTKTQRAVYRLMSNADYVKYEEINRQRAETKSDKKDSFIKGEKLLTLTNKIGDHDLHSRIKNVNKWLEKHYKVIAVITGNIADTAASEKIFQEISLNTSTLGKIVQKRIKGNDIKFQIIPLKKVENNTEEENENQRIEEKNA